MFCHRILKPTNSIIDCLLRLEKIIVIAIVHVIKSSQILKQATTFYLKKIYSLFEEEFSHGVSEMSLDCSSSNSL